VDDSLDQLVDIISDKPMLISWDSNVFGINNEIPLYLYKEDALELTSRTKELNITLI